MEIYMSREAWYHINRFNYGYSYGKRGWYHINMLNHGDLDVKK